MLLDAGFALDAGFLRFFGPSSLPLSLAGSKATLTFPFPPAFAAAVALRVVALRGKSFSKSLHACLGLSEESSLVARVRLRDLIESSCVAFPFPFACARVVHFGTGVCSSAVSGASGWFDGVRGGLVNTLIFTGDGLDTASLEAGVAASTSRLRFRGVRRGSRLRVGWSCKISNARFK